MPRQGGLGAHLALVLAKSRRTIRRSLLFAAVAVSLSFVQPPPATAAACLAPAATIRTRTTCESIEIAGQPRTYRLFVPANRNAPMPLVVALHGGGGTGLGMEDLARGRLTELAQARGFAIVYPDGIGRQWNDGRRDVRTEAHRRNIDDAGFVAALISTLAARFPIDPHRVFAAGISNGGLMALRLACDLADRLAAVAAVAASLASDYAGRCRPARPVSVLMMNGTADPLVPYGGGVITVGRMRRGKVVATGETLALFRAVNGCTEAPTVTPLADRDRSDGSHVVRTAWAGCADAAEVVLYRIEGGGHTWPGGRQARPALTGPMNGDIDAADAIWEFFARHGR